MKKRKITIFAAAAIIAAICLTRLAKYLKKILWQKSREKIFKKTIKLQTP
jgi:hypothetical protein